MQAAQCPAACEPIDDKGVDYKTLYLQEAEKNKQLLQWIVQLQSNLSVRLQTGGDTAALATWGSEQVSDNTLKAENSDTRQQEGVPARGTLREGVKVGESVTLGKVADPTRARTPVVSCGALDQELERVCSV